MCSALGGRAAEKVQFGKISTGALSDLEKVTKQAYAMVSIYGLNEKIGNISFYDPHGNQFTKPYSDDTAKMIDEEVSKLVESQYQRALQLLEDNKDKLAQLADKLLEKEVIFKEDLVAIFGKRPWDKEEELLKVEPAEESLVTEEVNSEEAIVADDSETIKENLDESSSENLEQLDDKTDEGV